jgi:putative oxygen-independent coproporphyrinogen III oxidase
VNSLVDRASNLSSVSPLSSLKDNLPRSAYVHIPFCRRRCFYCDFPISVVGDKPPQAKLEPTNEAGFGTIAQYVEVLCQEILHTPKLGQSLQTVFLGGGTPSLLTVPQLEKILGTLDQQFGIAAEAEISIEIDPGTFDWEKIQGYRSAGVNRVSLGVQAFQPELLLACGRSHAVPDIYTAVELIQRAAIPSFSLDLISGLPHQTLHQWQESLEKAIALSPNHLSTYDLTIEPMTAFGRRYKPGLSPLPTDEVATQMYRLAQQVLTNAGYEHYEISNYAQPGHQCRHNRIYWENYPFYGFGMGATSYLQGDRFARPRKTREYYKWVNERMKDEGGRMKVDHPSSLILHPFELLLDTLMVGLRLREGVSVVRLTEQFGEAVMKRVYDRLQPYEKNGWVTITTDRIYLTDPEGFLFSNVVLTDLFEEFGD